MNDLKEMYKLMAEQYVLQNKDNDKSSKSNQNSEKKWTILKTSENKFLFIHWILSKLKKKTIYNISEWFCASINNFNNIVNI